MEDLTITGNLEKYRDIEWEERCLKMVKEVDSYLKNSFLVEHKYGMVNCDREYYCLDKDQSGVHTVVLQDVIFVARGRAYDEVVAEEIDYICEKYGATKTEVVNMNTPGNLGEKLFRLFLCGDPMIEEVVRKMRMDAGPNPKGNVELYREAWAILRDVVSR